MLALDCHESITEPLAFVSHAVRLAKGLDNPAPFDPQRHIIEARQVSMHEASIVEVRRRFAGDMIASGRSVCFESAANDASHSL